MPDSNKYPPDLTDEQKKFLDLTLLQKYDAVLDSLFDASGESPTFDDLLDILLKNKKKIHWGEVWDIVNTMIGDGYVYKDLSIDNNEQIFLVSFNGKLLKETGGMEKKLEREKHKDDLDARLKTISINNIRITRLIAIWALIIAALGLIVQGIKVAIDSAKKEGQPKIILEQKVQPLLLPADLPKSVQKIQESVQHLDTAVKKVKIVK